MKQILAAFSFFTRLPFWRLADIPKECYERVVPLWPMVGWLTGGLMCLTYWGCSHVLPTGVCIMLALLVRVLVTGALHEDGFADFCDGFGGGTTRERTLEIMKDSHIGTYGVLGLIIYYLLLYNILLYLLPLTHFIVLLLADTFSKYSASCIIYKLPYARNESEAKNKLIYMKSTYSEQCISLVLGLLPFSLLMILEPYCLKPVVIAMFAAFVVSRLLFRWMRHRIQGYTGDCCGATFIITELTFHLVLAAVAIISFF